MIVLIALMWILVVIVLAVSIFIAYLANNLHKERTGKNIWQEINKMR